MRSSTRATCTAFNGDGQTGSCREVNRGRYEPQAGREGAGGSPFNNRKRRGGKSAAKWRKIRRPRSLGAPNSSSRPFAQPFSMFPNMKSEREWQIYCHSLASYLPHEAYEDGTEEARQIDRHGRFREFRNFRAARISRIMHRISEIDSIH
jgi:hypothetical protein